MYLCRQTIKINILSVKSIINLMLLTSGFIQYIQRVSQNFEMFSYISLGPSVHILMFVRKTDRMQTTFNSMQTRCNMSNVH